MVLPRASADAHWLHSLLLNVVGYSSVLLPGYAIYKYLQATKFLDKPGNTLFPINFSTLKIIAMDSFLFWFLWQMD